MFRRHHEPGLPSWPPLYVDATKQNAFIKMRIADWVAVERGHRLSKFAAGVFAIGCIPTAYALLPADLDMVGRLFATGLGAATSIVVGVPAAKKLLPDFLSRFVFARRIKIACTSEWIAFRSWYYDNGVRVSRMFNGGRISIQPTVEDDQDAKEHLSFVSASQRENPIKSSKHLSSASQLLLVIRSGDEPTGVGNMQSNRRFRTLPIAGMESSVAERFVTLIEAALELTAKGNGKEQVVVAGRDLDLPTSEES